MKDEPVNAATLRLLKHDIKNQLSNIQLALDSLKYEVETPTDDFTFCIDTISKSSEKIDALIEGLN